MPPHNQSLLSSASRVSRIAEEVLGDAIRLHKSERFSATIGLILVEAPGGQLSHRQFPEGWFMGFHDGQSLVKKITKPDNGDLGIKTRFQDAIAELMKQVPGTLIPIGIVELNEHQLSEFGYRGHL